MKKHLQKSILFFTAFILLSCQAISNSPDPIMPTSTPVPTVPSVPMEITDAQGVSMRLVPAGDFIMGSDDEMAGDAKPAHTVTLPDFYMDVYEVTRARYKECVTAEVCSEVKNVPVLDSFYRDADFPVSAVDWDMATAYCAWRGAHLPSEAEWEKAARGTDGRMYPWGEEIDETFVQLSGGPHEVGLYDKGKSPYGMYDMAGNVWEWTAEPLTAYPGNQGDHSYYRETDRVLRGGSWQAPDPVSLSSWFRFASFTGDNSGYTGFRCARAATP